VEVGIRVDDPAIAKQLWDILQLQLADNVNAREMRPDGSYAKVKPAEGQPLVDSQMELYNYFKDGFTATVPAGPEKKNGKETSPSTGFLSRLRNWFHRS